MDGESTSRTLITSMINCMCGVVLSTSFLNKFQNSMLSITKLSLLSLFCS